MIEWTSTLSTGVPLLDGHHQGLFKALSELESAALEQRTLFGVYALTRLKHYVRDHFSAEEAMMKAAAYPQLDEHIAEHAAFRAKLGELLVKSIGQDITADTISFLADWLVNHIGKTDMAYVPYLKKLENR